MAINRAQRELEQIRQLAYKDVALTTTPAASSDPKDPRYRVSGSDFALGWDGTTPSDYAEMVVKNIGGVTDGSVNPGPTSFTSGDISGKVYRYVVWRDDPSCQMVPNSTIDACPGPHDYKRVVVIVKLDDAPISSTRAYTEVQSNFSDPDATTQTSNDPGAGGPSLTAQQFFLSDTTCNNSARQDITADHAEHQTWGDLRRPESAEAGRPLHGGPTGPGPERPGHPAALRLRERRRAQPESRPGQGPPAPAPRRQRLQLQRRRQPPVQDPSLGEPAPGTGLPDERAGDARVLHADDQRRQRAGDDLRVRVHSQGDDCGVPPAARSLRHAADRPHEPAERLLRLLGESMASRRLDAAARSR